MRWVQQNIAAFGGDPRHVTIFGGSGGVSSVCDQIASPTARGLFEGAIDGSGEYNTLFGGPGVRPGAGESPARRGPAGVAGRGDREPHDLRPHGQPDRAGVPGMAGVQPLR